MSVPFQETSSQHLTVTHRPFQGQVPEVLWYSFTLSLLMFTMALPFIVGAFFLAYG